MEKMNLLKSFLFFLLISCSRETPEISKLSQIPREDLVRIERFLSFLVWDESFAYVLFGDKPMSVADQCKIESSKFTEDDLTPADELESLWGTWQKYAHLFPMSKFIFLTEGNDKYFEVYLLNKSNCLKVIENNLALFQEKTGCPHLSVSEMFDYIVTHAENNLFKNSLHKSQGLYGILLGFGTENSLGFERYYSTKRDPAPNSRAHIDMEDPILPPIPFFASFSCDETNDLVADYKRQREEILEIYSKKSFLQTTLSRLTEKG